MNETLRNSAYTLLGRIPEEKLYTVVEMLRGFCECEPDGGCGNSREFLRLMELCRPIGGLDEEMELSGWREERYLR